MKNLLIITALFLGATIAFAADVKLSTSVMSSPRATVPLNAGDQFLVIQGALQKRISSSRISMVGHTHSGVYEPVDATILRQAGLITSFPSTSTTAPPRADAVNTGLNQRVTFGIYSGTGATLIRGVARASVPAGTAYLSYYKGALLCSNQTPLAEEICSDNAASGVAGTVTVAQGGTGLTTANADTAIMGSGGTAAFTAAAIPNCQDSGGNHLNYNTSTHAWSCGTTGGTVGSVAFNAITGGTNTQAAMVVGTGGSLSATGSGTIAATTAGALAANGSNCSAGYAPLGVDAAGAVEGCWQVAASNASTTVNSQTCALGGSCTVTVPIATGVTGLGTGIGTWLATSSSANLASAVTDEIGSGPLVMGAGVITTTGLTQDHVYYRTSGSAWADADANGSGTYPARCYAISTTQCLYSGQYTKSSHGYTVGADLYLSETAGAVTTTAPTASASVVQKVGWVLDANTLVIAPSPDYGTVQ